MTFAFCFTSPYAKEIPIIPPPITITSASFLIIVFVQKIFKSQSKYQMNWIIFWKSYDTINTLTPTVHFEGIKFIFM